MFKVHWLSKQVQTRSLSTNEKVRTNLTGFKQADIGQKCIILQSDWLVLADRCQMVVTSGLNTTPAERRPCDVPGKVRGR